MNGTDEESDVLTDVSTLKVVIGDDYVRRVHMKRGKVMYVM